MKCFKTKLEKYQIAADEYKNESATTKILKRLQVQCLVNSQDRRVHQIGH